MIAWFTVLFLVAAAIAAKVVLYVRVKYKSALLHRLLYNHFKTIAEQHQGNLTGAKTLDGLKVSFGKQDVFYCLQTVAGNKTAFTDIDKCKILVTRQYQNGKTIQIHTLYPIKNDADFVCICKKLGIWGTPVRAQR